MWHEKQPLYQWATFADRSSMRFFRVPARTGRPGGRLVWGFYEAGTRRTPPRRRQWTTQNTRSALAERRDRTWVQMPTQRQGT